MTSIVAYEYRLMNPPAETRDLAVAQMRAAHRYRNMLVEIERERRARHREVMSGHPDTAPLAARVAELAAQRDAARQTLLSTRAAARARAESAADRERVRELGAQLKAVRAELRAAKQTIASDPEIQRAVQAVEDHARQRVRDERARCDVYWGTYLLQEAAADQARKATSDPQFRPWRGEGRVSVQLQGGLDLTEVWGGDTQLWIDPLPAGAHDPAAKRGARRAASRTLLHLRVGSKDRAPIWAVWPLVMHRPLPEGARIKVATVSRRRRDRRRWDWFVHLTLDISASQPRRSVPDSGAVALNLGYCLRPDGGIRAGYVVGDDGIEREILVPSSSLDRFQRSEKIQGYRDQNLNVARAELCAWIADQPATPEWFAERSKGLHAWRSAERLAALADAWRSQRWEGDAAGYEPLQAWRFREEHLQRMGAGLARGAALHRRETYRIVAAELGRRYGTLVIDDTDLHELQRSPAPESEDVEIKAVKRRQRQAAGSELRDALVNAFGRERLSVQSATDITRRHYACGSIETWDREDSTRRRKCSACGEMYDQDANACRNLLSEWARERDGARSDIQTSRSANPAPPLSSRQTRLRNRSAS